MFFRLLIILVFSGLLLSSCGDYRKVVKSTDLEYKYKRAVEYYENEDYVKAYPLFEELTGVFRGTSKAENIAYYLAYCEYNFRDYLLANHRFIQFYKTFPTSARAEECRFMSAYCSYLMSPKFSLDQTNTYKAIREFQLFTNQYPTSQKIDTCNILIDEMREKLEKKSFLLSKQYYKTGYYESAIIALNNTLRDFPGTEYKEEIKYLIVKSNYELAINSVPEKKADRIDKTIAAYITFVDSFPASQRKREVESMYNQVLKEKEKIEI